MSAMGRHRVVISLRWSDMDAYGHVNNVQFLRLLEDARVLAWEAHGTEDGGHLVDTAMLVAKHEIEYIEPLVFSTTPVAIDLWVSKLGGAGFDMGYEVLDEGDNPKVYARAESKMVVFDRVSQRPRRLSTEERDRLQAWVDSPVAFRHRHAPPDGRQQLADGRLSRA